MPIVEIIPGVWGIEGASHHNDWIRGAGKLAHDDNALPRILPHVPVGGVVVDAGAYIGTMASAFLQKVGPMGRVIAFEPNKEAFKALRLNCPKAESYCSALASRNAYGRAVKPGDTNFGTFQVLTDNPTETDEAEDSIPLVRLDDWELVTLDLLKADVEAGEYDLLLGAAETIRRCKPVLVAEINESALAARGKTPDDVLGLIRSFGYSVENIYPRQECSGPQWDALCKPL